jgi:hypothetical protein
MRQLLCLQLCRFADIDHCSRFFTLHNSNYSTCSFHIYLPVFRFVQIPDTHTSIARS